MYLFEFVFEGSPDGYTKIAVSFISTFYNSFVCFYFKGYFKPKLGFLWRAYLFFANVSILSLNAPSYKIVKNFCLIGLVDFGYNLCWIEEKLNGVLWSVSREESENYERRGVNLFILKLGEDSTRLKLFRSLMTKFSIIQLILY